MSTAQNPWPHIGQLFVEEGYLTSAQLEGALAEQRRSGERLGEILIERGYITRIHLAGALSKQWSWKGELPSSIETPATPIQLVEQIVEPEPEPAPAAPEIVLVPELPATDPPPPPTYPDANEVPVGAPMSPELDDDTESQPAPTPPIEESSEPTVSPVPTEAVAAPVTGLEDQERLLEELQARLRDTHEQLAAGEERIGSLDAILGELSQACTVMNARLDAQTREIEDLRRVVADQSTRLATAASALLA
jgi:hypothetical protein